MGKKDADAPATVVNVTAPEYHCDFGKISVAPGSVKVWGYSDLTDPTDGPPHRMPAAILSFPIPAFDLFLADCLRIRAILMTVNGKGVKDERPEGFKIAG